jgi:hypothetical protein
VAKVLKTFSGPKPVTATLSKTVRIEKTGWFWFKAQNLNFTDENRLTCWFYGVSPPVCIQTSNIE